MADRELLGGGNMGTVVRDGATVIRGAGPWTQAVHRLLHHLRSHGVPVPAPIPDHRGWPRRHPPAPQVNETRPTPAVGTERSGGRHGEGAWMGLAPERACE